MPRPKTDEGRSQRLAILDYCTRYKNLHGYYPTQTEIKVELTMSTGALTWHLKSLLNQGYISYQQGSFARTLRISRRKIASLQ
jgi:hypothetical protein